MKQYQWMALVGCVGVALVAPTMLESAGWSLILISIIYTIGAQSK